MYVICMNIITAYIPVYFRGTVLNFLDFVFLALVLKINSMQVLPYYTFFVFTWFMKIFNANVQFWVKHEYLK